MAEVREGVYSSELYREDIASIAELSLPWEQLRERSLLLTGATGMIGSFLVDVLMYCNQKKDLGCKLLLLGRDRKKALNRFPFLLEDNRVHFYECKDITETLPVIEGEIDYYIHAASNTHPIAYAMDPIGTVRLNVMALDRLLEHAVKHHTKRFMFLSSNEIYGENRGDTELFDESYCGYIDCNTLRAGYPESKRAGEALCQAYISQKGLDVVIPRLTRSYGPTMLSDDTKALSQFITNALQGKDIVLKSAGTQQYSFTYVADAVSGILYCLFRGEKGQAYNIADESGNTVLRDLAEMIAREVKTKAVFETPNDAEKKGYSTATKALLDGKKIRALGWRPRYNLETGIRRTLHVMRGLGHDR